MIKHCLKTQGEFTGSPGAHGDVRAITVTESTEKFTTDAKRRLLQRQVLVLV